MGIVKGMFKPSTDVNRGREDENDNGLNPSILTELGLLLSYTALRHLKIPINGHGDCGVDRTRH